MKNNHSYTLIIPTFNRPTLLRKLIAYLSNMQAVFQIIVLDSSNDDIQSDNYNMCANAEVTIDYYGYPDKTAPLEKWTDGLSKVSTEYVSFCADDDIVFPDAISRNLDFLCDNQDYVACHGIYFNFEENNNSKTYVEYSGSSIDGHSILKRFWQLMSNYEALSYATFRTDVIQNTFIKSHIFDTPMYAELFLGIQPLIRGKVKRLSKPYYARKSESGAARSHGTKSHPLTYFTNHTEEIFSEYVKYRYALIQSMTECEHVRDPEKVKRYIDLIHSVYFMYSCDINHIICILNEELNIRVPVFENRVVSCVETVNDYNKKYNVTEYDMLCATRELDIYNQTQTASITALT